MEDSFQQKPLSNLELAEFCNQMYMMLNAGISTLESLNLLLEDAKNEEERKLLEKLIEDVEINGYFYEAAVSSGVFPKYSLQMFKLGEETGTLDRIMYSLAEHYTRENNLAGMIRSAFIYPSIMLGMMLLIIIVLLTKVMPVFQQVFQQLGQEMSGFSAGLLTVGKTLSNYSIVFVILAAGLVVLLAARWKKLPFQQNLQEKIAACRFADGMAITLKSGMTPEQGMELVKELVENKVFEEKIDKCQELLNEGMDFSEAIHESQIFQGSYARMTLIASRAGVMDDAMSQISSDYEYAVNAKISSLIAILEPTLVIVLSLIVGGILFSVMLPLLGIMAGL